MDIINKIGTFQVTLESRGPNYKLINQLTRPHQPLTPDLFPFYAGSWVDDYNNQEIEEVYDNFVFGDQIKDYENGLATGDYNQVASPNQIAAVENMIENEKQNHEVVHNEFNNNQEALANEDQLILNQIDDTLNKTNVNQLKDLNELIKEYNMSNVQNIEIKHEQEIYNDLNDKDQKANLSINERIDNIFENKQETKSESNLANATLNTEQVNSPNLENNSASDTVVQSLPNIGHEPKFVVKSSEKDKLYDNVLSLEKDKE